MAEISLHLKLHGHKAVRDITQLLDGWRNGQYQLPDETVRLYDALAHLASTPTPDLPSPHELENRFHAETVEAALAARELPDIDILLDAHNAAEKARPERRIRDLAEQTLAARLATSIHLSLDDIYRRLAEAHAEVIGAATPTAQQVAAAAGIPPNPDLLLAAAKAPRDAWAQLAEHAGRYTAIRRAVGNLRRLGHTPDADRREVFGEASDLPDVWPDFARYGATPPWPDDPRGRLAWLCVNAKPWLPSPQQQDDRYRQVFGDTDPHTPTPDTTEYVGDLRRPLEV